MKNRNKILLGLALFISFAFILWYASPHTISKTTYFDENLGLVTQKLSTCSWLCKLINPTQQAYFLQGGSYPSYYTIGESVTVKEELLISKSACLTRGILLSVQQNIYKSGSLVTTLPAMFSISKPITPTLALNCPTDYSFTKTTTFTPSSVGIYTIDTSVKREFDFGVTKIACTGTSTQCNLDIRDKPVVNTCTKVPYWSNWLEGAIANGIVKTRLYYDVSSSCSFIESNKEQVVVCSSGFNCDGTNTQCAFPASCEANPVTEEPIIEEPSAIINETIEEPPVIPKNCILTDTCIVQKYYNLVDNQCIESETGKYQTLEDCNKDIVIKNDYTIYVIIGILIFSGVVVFFLIKKIIRK